MLLGTLGANLLGNLLTGKGGEGQRRERERKNRADEGILRGGYGNKMEF